MRGTALVIVLLAVALCLLAPGTDSPVVKVYFTARNPVLWSAQIWRCNRDGSEPELLLSGDYLHTGLAVDSAIGKLFYTDGGQLLMAELDASNPVYVGGVWPEATNRYAAEGGYVC